MKISKTKILTILVSLIGILNYEQSKINSDIISTWKFIENKTESNQNKIDENNSYTELWCVNSSL